VPDIADLAYAVLLERIEGDARAERSAGADEPVESYRARLDALLTGEEKTGRAVSAEERELRRELGVA
jgi:hypothetical protein